MTALGLEFDQEHFTCCELQSSITPCCMHVGLLMMTILSCMLSTSCLCYIICHTASDLIMLCPAVGHLRN